MTCRVITDNAELPRGTRFTVCPGAPVENGQLVLFRWNGVEQIGRLHPGPCWIGWLVQPDRVIYFTDMENIQIVGPIVPFPALDVCEAGRIKAAAGCPN